MRRNKVVMKAIAIGAAALAMTGCKIQGDGNFTGLEYAPQMYHSVPYEPLSQFTYEGISGGVLEQSYYPDFINSNPYNDYFSEGEKRVINVKDPVAGTVKRQNFSAVTGDAAAKPNQPILYYMDVTKEQGEWAAENLKNPLEATPEVVAQGKHLFTAYCQPCHGEAGDGKGKVGKVYGGVANLKGKSIKKATDGHIFFVITHGKGRMWSHKSQLNPQERWAVVKYVRKLQGN
ncbi:c-type cytochrome [Flammeovirga kamogawensis]|uniref:Cytochrome c n=1 Tax=Flammeovirga kamogawensis TaxID=373891 RepID=A0ABX8GT41_9BACT|nr:cytochrome c [Flammeovirga kamogawensis]MBB6462500.1 mono/diheme cytochrome c family protein [Flammeovirga kamogawensis]QWG06763.1 cytochrome c [Flammeovirga kamogawensis]TRX68586.1 cytochrome c [Flammeovirga kamogawensis]